MNRYMIYYDMSSSQDVLSRETARIIKMFPEPRHFIINPFMLFVKSPEPLGKFIEKVGFGSNIKINGFVVQIYNINGWYRTQLWDWYYSK